VASAVKLTEAGGRLVRAFADVFFPRFCIICGKSMPCEMQADICQTCERETALGEGRYCRKCAAPMARYADKCPNCHNMHLALDGATAFGRYGGDLRSRIIEFKFSGGRHLARTLGILAARAAAKAWPQARFDAVAGIPLHRTRRGRRGFDQAQALAHYAALALAVPDRRRLLTRTRPTESQVALTKTARMRNVKDAFEAAAGTQVSKVLLVDDIMTTGATASAAARALKRSGVKAVYAVVVARAGFEEVLPGHADDDRPAAAAVPAGAVGRSGGT
jgi:ComF family protein